MAFKHQTYRLDFLEGGLSGSDNFDSVPETAFIIPSRNLELFNGLREKRGGTVKVNSTAITGTPKCLGLGVWSQSAAAANILSAHADGKVYKDQTTVIATGMSTANHFDINRTGDTMTICDGATTPQVWTGSGTATSISTSAADWSGSAQPKFSVVHARGAERRLVMCGVPGFESSWYCSASGNYQDFGSTNVLKFTGAFPDGYGVTAAADFNQDLFLFGKRRTLIFNDADTNTANWGWVLAPWEGGAAHQNLVIKVDNDMYAMMDSGDIYSVRTVAQVNDYKKASLTRPAFIHRYMSQNVDLTKIADFHVSYDPTLRAILWWVIRIGFTTPDTCLVYYLDRQSPSNWSIWDGTDNNLSGLRATASTQIINTDGSQGVVTGDASGFIWKLNQPAHTDDGNAYNQVMRTAWQAFKNPRNEKRFVNARLICLVSGSVTINFRWFVDSTEQTSSNQVIVSEGSVFPLTFGSSTFGAPTLTEVDIPLGQIGRRIMFDIEVPTGDQNLRLAELLVDFEDRGPRYL